MTVLGRTRTGPGEGAAGQPGGAVPAPVTGGPAAAARATTGADGRGPVGPQAHLAGSRSASVAAAGAAEDAVPRPRTGTAGPAGTATVTTRAGVTVRRWEVLRCLAAGLVAGLVWGWTARLWMAFLVDVPVFTWAGTLFILGLSGGAGLLLGVVEGLRRRGARLWRLLVAVPALALFVGQGIPFLPGAVLGGLALSGRGPVWLRVGAGVLGASPVVLFWLPAFSSDEGGNIWLAALWFELLAGGLALGWAAVWRRRARLSGAAASATAGTAA